MSTKLTLVIFGIIVIVFGFLSLLKGTGIGPVPLWFGLLEIVIGLLAAIIGLMSKRP